MNWRADVADARDAWEPFFIFACYARGGAKQVLLTWASLTPGSHAVEQIYAREKQEKIRASEAHSPLITPHSREAGIPGNCTR